ncbi:hypothetical protein [Ruminococcus sp. Marseille-P6503]|uniref:hypothetical protein n=1 Tax=Ruminococcus sp. Marseille-P6503 TaxID=2364796 RepID=UPI000F51CD2A|nr:hypothetical protein [Ruminococcus sp. Marseille-P6503]
MSKYIEAANRLKDGMPLSEEAAEALKNGADILESVPDIYKVPALLAKQQKGFALNKIEKEYLSMQLMILSDSEDDETADEAEANDKLAEELLKDRTRN